MILDDFTVNDSLTMVYNSDKMFTLNYHVLDYTILITSMLVCDSLSLIMLINLQVYYVNKQNHLQRLGSTNYSI